MTSCYRLSPEFSPIRTEILFLERYDWLGVGTIGVNSRGQGHGQGDLVKDCRLPPKDAGWFGPSKADIGLEGPHFWGGQPPGHGILCKSGLR